ncbi:hypothetical protein AVEN_61631-1 [Araneus ventricosus]|uniref:CCHC-type domain-containing protein n=1 Tax=Araneus ventricosus TaxID=182803 RepID=A0A4Y2HIT8_ARAVE|nr:hypothetical protein AVEN_61631-1 [Araneus ventricosus]
MVRIGFNCKKELKAKQLHKLITESPSYDEEFTRELLGSIKKEREKKEESEKAEREREREKEAREEREREREDRERERKKRERERDRDFELQKLELEARTARAHPVESMQITDRSAKIRMHDVMLRFKEDDHSDKWDGYRHQKDHRQREDARQRDRFQNKNQNNSFHKRYRPSCFECGSYEHFKPQCPRLKSNEKIICVCLNDDLLETHTIRGLVNGFELPILRDTGATVDVISQKFVDYAKMTGEHVWVKYLLNDHLVCLPLAEVEIKCELGHIKTKAAVFTNYPGRYVLCNKTANIFKDKPFLKLKKINAVMTRSQEKRSSELVQNKETEMEQPEEMTHFEIDEEILPQADEEYKKIKKLVEVDCYEFIESQHQSRDLAPLLNEAKTENSSKLNYFKIKENGMLVKKKIDKNENERELIVVPEKYRDQIKSLCHDSTSGHLGIVKTKDRLA